MSLGYDLPDALEESQKGGSGISYVESVEIDTAFIDSKAYH